MKVDVFQTEQVKEDRVGFCPASGAVFQADNVRHGIDQRAQTFLILAQAIGIGAEVLVETVSAAHP